MATSSRVRWGILGTGGINDRFLAHVPKARNADVVAVGSRTIERAREFAARFGIGRAHGTYDALLGDPEVDAVYICLPNSLHHEWTMKAIAAGKHVLCEKPYSRRAADVSEAFDAADAAGVRLMEAFMWRHNPQVRRFLELLPEIGELRAIRSTFAFDLDRPTDVRLRADLDGGSLMDVGCYCVSGARLLVGAEPVRVHGEQVTGPTGVDVAFAGALRFPGDVLATFVSGFTLRAESLEAIGPRGVLRMPDPFIGRKPAIWLDDREIPIDPIDPYLLEVENMSAAIRGEAEPLLGRADALGQARTIEALYVSAAAGGQPVSLGS